MEPSGTSPSRGSTWRPLALTALALVVLAWLVRQGVDRNGGYFSNNELGVWLGVMGVVTGACLLGGLALVRRPLGRGLLAGTVLATLAVGATLFLEVLVNSA